MHSRPRGGIRGTLVLPIVLAVTWPILARQSADSPLEKVRERYTKYEYRVPMRDGVRLFTAVYVPKDVVADLPAADHAHALQRRPRMARTPTTSTLGPSKEFQDEGFIFVYQDARGRYMSEGEFQQVRPHVPDKRRPKDVDESTRHHDTIEWLLKHVPNHNGRVGMVGVSQPGFHVAASLIERASRAQGRLAPGTHGRLLHGRRRVPQRRVHAGGELRLLFELPSARSASRRRRSLRSRSTTARRTATSSSCRCRRCRR